MLFLAVLTAASLVAVISTPVNASGECIPAPPDIVSWWPGEGNPNDVVASNRGTLVNGVAFEPGMVGQAFSFDGVDGHVDVAHADNIFFENTDPLSLEVWFQPQSETARYFVLKNANYGLRCKGQPRAFFSTTEIIISQTEQPGNSTSGTTLS